MNFDGMWAEPGSDPREALEPGRGEKAVLAEYLDRYRMTFELKCEGLSADQLATSATPICCASASTGARASKQ